MPARCFPAGLPQGLALSRPSACVGGCQRQRLSWPGLYTAGSVPMNEESEATHKARTSIVTLTQVRSTSQLSNPVKKEPEALKLALRRSSEVLERTQIHLVDFHTTSVKLPYTCCCVLVCAGRCRHDAFQPAFYRACCWWRCQGIGLRGRMPAAATKLARALQCREYPHEGEE